MSTPPPFGGPQGWGGPPGGGQGGAPPPPGGQQPGGYQQPPGGYQQPPGGYQQPAGGYQQPPGGPGGFQGPPGGFQGPGGYGPPPKKSVWSSPAFIVPLVIVLVAAIGGGIFLATRSDDADVALEEAQDAVADAQDAAEDAVADAEDAVDDALADAMAGVPSTMPDDMAPMDPAEEQLADSMANPSLEAADTEGVRPPALGEMPDAPPVPDQPAPQPQQQTTVPDSMTSAMGTDDAQLAQDLRANARPISELEVVTIPVAQGDAAAVTMNLVAGEIVTVTVSGRSNPDAVVFGPDDLVLASDTDSGPGDGAKVIVVAGATGSYLVGAANVGGAAGDIIISYRSGVAEFQVLDLPAERIEAGAVQTYPVELFAGEVLVAVAIPLNSEPLSVAIGQGGAVQASGEVLAGDLRRVELTAPSDGFYDVMVGGGDTGADFFLYVTVEVRS